MVKEQKFTAVAEFVIKDNEPKSKEFHPDPCWVIEFRESGKIMILGTGCFLCIFSSKDLATSVIRSQKLDSVIAHCYSWEGLVLSFCKIVKNVILDYTGIGSFQRIIPLK